MCRTRAKLVLVAAVVFMVAACQPQKPNLMGASGGVPPIINPTWSYAAWFIDPANTSGCASDNNSCTSSVCSGGGVGPCLTWSQVNYGRWGCAGNARGCPKLAQNTTITFMSSQSNPGDPVIFFPELQVLSPVSAIASGNGPTVQIVGTLVTTSSGVSGTLLSAKNRTTNTRLRYTVTGSTIEELVQNTTSAKNSYAWSTGNASEYSQPLVPVTIASNGGGVIPGTEINTWATSDTFSLLTPPNVWIQDVEPISTALSGQALVVLSHLVIPENRTNAVQPGDDQVRFNQYVSTVELASERQVYWDIASPASGNNNTAVDTNCTFLGGFVGGSRINATGNPGNGSINNVLQITGGTLMAQESSGFGGTGSVIVNGAYIDDDTHINSQVGGATFSGYNYFGAVEFRGNGTLLHGVIDEKTANQFSNGNILWGQGTLDVAAGTLIYPSTGAAAANPLAGGLQMMSQTKACVEIPTAAVTTFTCNTTSSAASADTLFDATSYGCFIAGPASICNYGP